jgi:hypothetical protein
MADKVKVKLLRPLNGLEVGSTAEYHKADAKRLEARGAVKVIGEVKSEDGAPQNKKEPAPANKSAAKTEAK